MARLSSQADFGYVPLDRDVARTIGSYFAMPQSGAEQARAFDPCIGDGSAFGAICDQIGIPVQHRYGCDLHTGRAEEATQYATHIARTDAIKHLRVSSNAWVFGYLNPPFDHDARSEGSGRLEVKFIRRFLMEEEAIQRGTQDAPGGGVAIVAPQDVVARADFLSVIARVLTDIHIVSLPDHLRHFREVVVMGTMCHRWRALHERDADMARLTELLAGDVPVIQWQDAPRYVLPVPTARKRVIWKDARAGTPESAQRECIQTGGVYASDAYKTASHRMRRKRLNPRFPLHPGQRVFRIAAGEINGKRVTIGGEYHIIKGGVIPVAHEWTTTKETDTARITEKRRVVNHEPVVTGISEEHGTIRQWRGAAEIARLLASEETSQAITEAIAEACPPTYRLEIEAELQQFLQAVTPTKALPGQKPGLLPMQQHVIAAATAAVTTYDDAWGCVPRSVIISADMGCGKTPMGLVASAVLNAFHRTTKPRKAVRKANYPSF